MQHYNGMPTEVALWLDSVQLHESPWIYTRWAALSAAAAQAGRNVYLPNMHGKTYANMYVLLVGAPGSRKSTVLKYALDMLKKAGHVDFCPTGITKTSMHNLLKTGDHSKTQATARRKAGIKPRATCAWDDEDGEHSGSTVYSDDDIMAALDDTDMSTDAEGVNLTIWAHELQNMFPRHGGEAFAALQELYDTPEEIEVRGGILQNPYVTMFALLNTETLPVIFQHRQLINGLLSRLIFVHGAKSGRTFNQFEAVGAMPAIEPMAALLRDVGELSGAMSVTHEAQLLLKAIQEIPQQSVHIDGRFDGYLERRGQHLNKMCMCHALLRRSLVINEDDVKYSHTLLAYTETFMPQALGEYGYNKDSTAQRAILAYLGKVSQATSAQILTAAQHFLLSNDDLMQTLAYMESASLIKKVSTHGGDSAPLYLKVSADLNRWSRQFGVTVFPEYLEEWAVMLGY